MIEPEMGITLLPKCVTQAHPLREGIRRAHIEGAGLTPEGK